MANDDNQKNQKKKVDTSKGVAKAGKVDKKANKAKTSPAAKVDKKANKAKTSPAAKVDKKANKAKKVAGSAAAGGKNATAFDRAADSAAIALDVIETVNEATGDDDEAADDPEGGIDMKSIISCLTCCIRGSMAAARAAESMGDAAVCQKCGAKLKIGKNKGGKSRLCSKCAKR